MFKCIWFSKCFTIKYITKKQDEFVENKDIPIQSFLDIGNILLEQGGIDLLEEQKEIIVENLDIPHQSFLDLGKTLLENSDLNNTLDK
jgi:hypothetical protein